MSLRVNNKVLKVPYLFRLINQMQKPQRVKHFKIILITFLKILQVLKLSEPMLCLKQVLYNSHRLQCIRSIELIMSQLSHIKKALN